MSVTRVDAAGLDERIEGLAELLVDAVRDGASVGFLAPLDPPAALARWKGRSGAVADGTPLVWAAHDGGRVLGTVSLALAGRPNSRHRAALAS
ncbi:hypothetical protein SZN_10473 [Streptomyces zinciresistens K42]|uniref:GNAT family N-acetyltransferase n=1 Tax=Streptomyces zinciresistens K42 TaxID=700597 RepID=G2G9I1_9ACTN|nr:hypothetical protein SZN_10473 [Streptomyces zinciresistens K42]